MTEQRVQVTVSGTGAVGVGRDNKGIISTGAGAQIQQINQYAGRPEVTWPHPVGTVPPLAPGYLARMAPAAELDQVLNELRDAGGHALIMSGMGGVGKTQLAAAH